MKTNLGNFRLFIIDGVISLPIAFASFYFLPDTPNTNRGSYFTEAVRF
jgi:ACS family pantothenate transporter-like MFS transporter